MTAHATGTTGRRRRPTAVDVAVLVATGATVVFLALVRATGALAWARDNVLYDVVPVAVAVALVLRGRRTPRGTDERRMWLLLGIGLSGTAAGELVSGALRSRGVDPTQGATVADAAFLAYYPAAWLALLAGLRARVPRWYPSVWLDAVTGGTAAGAVALALAGPAVAAMGRPEDLSTLVALAYPVGDLLLLTSATAALAVLRGRPDSTWSVIGLGLLVTAAADVAYTVTTWNGSYASGGWVDGLFLGGMLLFGCAALLPAFPARRRARADSGWLAPLALPGAAGTAAVVLLVREEGAAVNLLAVAVLVAVAVRVLATYRQVWELAQARQEARTDELTGLANRRGFYQAALPRLRAAPAGAALLVLDLDNFKEVNDSLGHLAGDELLAVLADRLRTAVHGGDDLLARIGGDEFAVLLAPADETVARRCAERIAAALTAPVAVEGVRVDASASIGIAVCPQHGDELSILMRRADIAMYRAKAGRSGIAVYDPALLDGDGEDRLQRTAEVRDALDRDQLVVHYQAKVDLGTRRVCGAEALVRWAHPTRGLLLPAQFLPLVESTGLMPELTRQVLDKAVRQTATWWHHGRRIAVSVNLPAEVVVDARLPGAVRELLERYRLPPAAIQLEITESSLLTDLARARAVLTELRALGLSVAIDDYGSGYSSLSYLADLPVDELKLDRQVIAPICADARAASIVRSTIELAHSLGLTTVAEGVEDAQSAADLAGFGCDTAQGWFFARAVPADDLDHLLSRPVEVPSQPVHRVGLPGWQPPRRAAGAGRLPRR